jgi:hypothetical protein
MRFGVGYQKEVIEETRLIFWSQFRLIWNRSTSNPKRHQVMRQRRGYSGKWPSDQVAQSTLVDRCTQGVLNGANCPVAGLHGFGDNQVGLDRVIQRCQQRRVGSTLQHVRSQLYEIRYAQGRQWSTPAFPALDTRCIYAELFGKLDLGEPRRFPD